MPGVAVVIPWRDTGCPHRADALAWVLLRWHHTHPDWPVTLAPAPDGPWIKAAAVTPAVAALDADVVIVADADVWTDSVQPAVDAVNAGEPWAIPHRRVLRLTADATERVFAGQDPDRLPVAERPYLGVAGGGIVVLRHSTYLDVPLDARFSGWGGEDQAWALALTCLAAPPWRGRTNLFHLWHPPQERMNRMVGSEENEALRRRYRDAKPSVAQMRALVDQGKEASWPRSASS